MTREEAFETFCALLFDVPEETARKLTTACIEYAGACNRQEVALIIAQLRNYADTLEEATTDYRDQPEQSL